MPEWATEGLWATSRACAMALPLWEARAQGVQRAQPLLLVVFKT